MIREPNTFQKFFLKVFTGSKSFATKEKLQKSALTIYNIIMEIKKYCDQWEKMLIDTRTDITKAQITTDELLDLLEKYIIAGYLAQERIEQELEEKKQKYLESGLARDKKEYDDQNSGYKQFQRTMSTLEQARVTYILSKVELDIIGQSNINVQQAIKTKNHTILAIMSDQLRNAMLNQDNKEVIDGQQAIHKLNNEMFIEFAGSISESERRSEKMLGEGIYDKEHIAKAIQITFDTCTEIGKIANEELSKIKAENAEMNSRVEELEKVVNGEANRVKEQGKLSSTNISSSGLKY